MPIPKPRKGEHRKEFVQRCMLDHKMMQEYQTSQRYAVCQDAFSTKLAEQTYNDYPKQATENAKIAIRYAEENGWGECLTQTGKTRAYQLANRENISEDTIARMSGFERHRQNSTKELGDGCGRLAWLAWGGDEGIEWAKRKLEQIRK